MPNIDDPIYASEIVSCAQWNIEQPLRPGYSLGKCCEVCGTALQVSPSGMKRLSAPPPNGRMRVVACNKCAVALTEEFEALTGKVADASLFPSAVDTLSRRAQQDPRIADFIIRRAAATAGKP